VYWVERFLQDCRGTKRQSDGQRANPFRADVMTILHGRGQIEYSSWAADGQLKLNDLEAVAAFVRL